MKAKTGLIGLVAALALTIAPSLMAQNVGFHVAFGQATFGFPGTQSPAVFVKPPFANVPRVIIPPPPLSFFQIPQVVPVPAFLNPPVVVTNIVVTPGQTAVQIGQPALPLGPAEFIPAGRFQRQAPLNSPVPAVVPGRRLGPLAGTSRAEVLRQYGPPSVTMYTSAGETLYFTGGVTVIIENGQVAGPK